MPNCNSADGDGSPWTHGIVEVHGSEDQCSRSLQGNCDKEGCIITRTQKQMKDTPIWADDYLHDKLYKRNTP